MSCVVAANRKPRNEKREMRAKVGGRRATDGRVEVVVQSVLLPFRLSLRFFGGGRVLGTLKR
jgi:hypothetical protein